MTSESKRGQTPVPPEPKRPASHRTPTHHKRQGLGELLALDSERSSRLMLIGSVLLILVLAVGFILFGYWDTVIKPRHRTVLGAEGITVSYTAMKQRMAYDIQQNPTYLQSQQLVTTLPQSAYGELLEEIILIKRAPSDQDIKVSDSELQQALDAKVGVPTNASKQAFAAAFRGVLQKSGLSEDAYRRIVLADTLRTKLQAKFQSELPATVPQAKIDVIQVNTKADADKALARVKAGEDWATVAKSVSKEPNVATTGGTHDYAPEGDVNSAYSGFAFSAAIGQISDVITSGSGTTQRFYVARVVDRADKALTAAQKPAAVQRRYGQWVDSMRTKMTITDHWTNDQTSQTNALISVLKSVPPPTAVATVAAAAPPATTPGAAGTAVATGTAGAGVPPANPQPGGTSSSQPTAGANQPVAPNAPVAPGGGNAP